MNQEEKQEKTQNPLRQIFLAIGIVTGFIFIAALTSLYASNLLKEHNACGCIIPIPIMMLVLSSLGVFAGSMAFYFFSSGTRKNKKNRNKVSATLRFLESDERKMFEALVKHKNGVNQAKLEQLTGFHRVKVHRVLNKLLNKEVIEKESVGKINKIKLKKGISELF